MHLKKPHFWDVNYPTIFSIILWPLSKIYLIIFNLKKFFSKSKIFNCKIICVGNIYIGGTGKTPLSDKISELLKKYYKVAVIKKDYKNHKDEIFFLKKKN